MSQLRIPSLTPSHSLAAQLVRREADSVTSQLISAQQVSSRLVANGIKSLPLGSTSAAVLPHLQYFST
jgi:hypothetical protein